MAYTSIIPVHRLDRAVEYVQNKAKTTRGQNSAASLEEAVEYAMNRDKTEQSIFKTALGCRVISVFDVNSPHNKNDPTWYASLRGASGSVAIIVCYERQNVNRYFLKVFSMARTSAPTMRIYCAR